MKVCTFGKQNRDKVHFWAKKLFSCGLSSQSLCSHFIRTGVSTSKLKVEDAYKNAKGFLHQMHNCGTGKAEKQPTDSTNRWIESKTIIWETVQIVLLHENSFTLNGQVYFWGVGGRSFTWRVKFEQATQFQRTITFHWVLYQSHT